MGVQKQGQEWLASCDVPGCGWSKAYRKDYLATRGLLGHGSGHRTPTPTPPPMSPAEPAAPVVIWDERGMLETYITEVWVSPTAKRKVAGILRHMEHTTWYDLDALRWALSKVGCPVGDMELILENWRAYHARTGDASPASRSSAPSAGGSIAELDYEVEKEFHRLERFEARQAILDRVRRGGTNEPVIAAINALKESIERLEREILALGSRLGATPVRPRISP